MSKKAFDKIAEGLNEAVAIARGEIEPARLLVPAEISVRSIRAKLHLSQEDFASTFGFSIHQIRQWEQNRARPLGANRAFLLLIDSDPLAILRMLQAAAKAARKAA